VIRRRWVDVSVGAVLLLGAVIVALAGTADRLPGAGAGVALLVAAYLVARPSMGDEEPRRFGLFVAGAAIAMTLMTFAEPSLATMQVIVYPLVWIFSPDRRGGIVGSLIIGAAVFAGYAVGFGFAVGAVVESLAVASLSASFSIAMGWWITAIAAYGDERARLLADLTLAQKQVEALSRDKGAADERERLAREIHDTLAQTLAGLVILAEQAGRRWRAGDADGAASTVGHLETVARDALDETRAIVARTAAVPGDRALGAAVERLAARFRADTGLEIVVTAPAEPGEPLDRDAQVVLLRCLQEGLANVRKHAAAARVAVTVACEHDGGVRLTVADDGRGFEAEDASPRIGYGLDGMRERVALAGGSIELASAPGAGTTLTVSLPAPVRVGEAA